MKSVDKYVYPGTTVLINKFNCKDAEKLREIEALSTGGNLAYLQFHPIKGKGKSSYEILQGNGCGMKKALDNLMGMNS